MSEDNNSENNAGFDAFFLVSFGGPEGKDDVMPYLENVLRGKNVPRERMLEVAEHYYSRICSTRYRFARVLGKSKLASDDR